MLGKPRAWIPALAFFVALLAIGTSGFVLFKHHSSEMKSAAQDALAAVADLKVGQIVRWLDDQRRDAEVISRDNLLAEEVERWFQQGAPEGVLAQKILAKLASLRQVNQYESIVLLDEKARPRLPVGTDQHFDSHDTNFALQAMRENAVTHPDIHWSDEQKPEIDMIAPLAVPGTTGPHVIGAVYYHVDPSVFFFPYIQSWPTKSPSGETLLVRRDGNEALFLNELRHRKDAALKLRLPMDQPLLVAAMALRGETEVTEGVDYRGVPVFAATRKVPGTPWILVAKLDKAEVEAPLRRLAATAGGLAALFVLLAGAIAALWWRKQHAQSLATLSEEKLQRLALEQHFDYATKLARDMILLFNETGRLVECNDAALAAYGYTREELLQLTLSEVWAARAVAAIPGAMEKAALPGGSTFETEHRRKDGSSLPVEVSMRRIEIEGRQFYQSIVRDVTERKNQQERIARLNRIYVVLSAINSAIIHIRDPKALASEACRIAVELGGYLTANIFLIDRDSRVARAVGHAGIQKSYYEALEIDLDRPPMEGDGPLRILFRTGKHVVEAVGKEGPEGKPVSRALQRGLKVGFRSMAAFPLVVEGQVIGALQLSSANPNEFDEEEVRLLLQLSADAALGFNHIEKEKQIGESEERFRATFEQAGVGMGLRAADPRNPRWLRVNQKLCDIFGYTREELLQLTTVDLTPPEERQLAIDYNEQLTRGDLDSYAREKQYVRKDGTLIWTSISLSAVREPGGRPTHIISVITDISERKKAEEGLRESEKRYRRLFHANPHSMWVYDLETLAFLAVNDAAVARYGWSHEEFLAMTIAEIHPAEDVPRLLENIGGVEEGKVEEAGVWTQHKKDGSLIAVEISSHVIDFGGRRAELVLANDITERKRAEERIHHLAHYDELTGLPNRSMFTQGFDHALAQARRNEKPLAVLFINLDRFKNINDTLGHDAGDHMLKEVAQRLLGCLRESDTASRLGGDEFVVLLEGMPQPVHGAAVARKVLAAVARPFTIGGQKFHLTASIGISTYPADSDDTQSLMRNADAAMYRAKEQGKNNFQFYSPEMNVHTLERLALESDLRCALECGEFVLHYQPKVDMGSGRISGMEALLRWLHPTKGLIPPMQFIPLAEETGLIVQIGQWVLRTACAQNKSWREQGLPSLRVAVNLSARQFADEHLLQIVETVLNETALDPTALELEITESMVMHDPEAAIKLMGKLKALGIALSIDDFGTGYSSLSYLKRFPIDSVKIDRSFIQDLPGDSNDAAITRAIIAMAHSLKLKVIAEGVETEEQLRFLRDHDCDEIQGYYFSKPVPEQEFVALLLRDVGSGKPEEAAAENL